jgi:adenosyl cobinamide kinase/adenosyl cobinamide phosphate guanylyltransferase
VTTVEEEMSVVIVEDLTTVITEILVVITEDLMTVITEPHVETQEILAIEEIVTLVTNTVLTGIDQEDALLVTRIDQTAEG